MLNNGEVMVAYPFEGYWRDVGTIQSLWEANMDLLGQKPVLDLDDDSWRIYTRNPVMPPHYISLTAQVTNSLVSEGAVVEGTVTNSVIFSGARIEKGAEVKDSIIFPNAVVGKNATVEKAIVGENSAVGDFSIVGGPVRPGEKVNNKLTGDITLIGNDVTIPQRAYLAKGAVVNTENPHQPAKEA
jgi:glucose-1-phosphate adenylyltransferase